MNAFNYLSVLRMQQICVMNAGNKTTINFTPSAVILTCSRAIMTVLKILKPHIHTHIMGERQKVHRRSQSYVKNVILP